MESAGYYHSPGSKVPDLGSGKGLTSVYLANEFDTDVIGFDKDVLPEKTLESMMKCAPDRIPLPQKGDARDLPFAKDISASSWQQIP